MTADRRARLLLALGVERIAVERGSVLGHFGGDPGLMAHFTELLHSGSRAVRASGRAALESHLVGFAAEQARETGRVVDMQAFRSDAYRAAGLAPR